MTGNPIGVKRLMLRRTGLCDKMGSVCGGKESRYLMEVVFTTQWGYVTLLAMPRHSTIKATGRTHYGSVQMENKLHHFMFCYVWRANGEKGEGHSILQNDSKDLTMKDIDEAVSFIKVFISKRMHHDKDSIQVIFTNVIHLAYLENSEFYNNET